MTVAKITTEAETVGECELEADGDVLEAGILRINEDRQPVAYAALGETTVTITRTPDGRVRVEIDDIAEEPVWVSANLQTLAAAEEGDDGPWHGDKAA